MKKSLFAVAAVTAFAGAAQAQSSVTVYGLLDVGFAGTTTRLGNQKQNNTSFTGTGSESTSRLGFRGTEDLGGGTRAFFTAEFDLAPTNWNLSGDNNDGIFNRQTFVGLGQKGIGQAAIGTQYTPVHLAVARTDPGQANNMAGNLIYAVNAATGSGSTGVQSYQVRYNNAITFQSERISGLQVYAIYNNNNGTTNNPSTVQTTANNQAMGAGLNFVWKKLNIDLATNQSKQATISGSAVTAATNPATAARNAAVPNLLGTSIGWSQNYAAATYDFGFMTVYAQYLQGTMTSNLNDQMYIKRSAQQIGVRSFVTPKIEAWASGSMGKLSAGGLTATTSTVANALATSTRSDSDMNAYQLGTNYWLSKRTNMYAIFGQTTRSQSAQIISAGQNSYGLGVRHTF